MIEKDDIFGAGAAHGGQATGVAWQQLRRPNRPASAWDTPNRLEKTEAENTAFRINMTHPPIESDEKNRNEDLN